MTTGIHEAVRLRLLIVPVVALLALPATAIADTTYRGKTQQKRTVALTFGADNLLQTARINWITRRCAESGARFQHITSFRTPFDASTPEAFRDAESFRVDDRGGIRSRVNITFAGRRASDALWRGTLRARVVVRKRGKVIDRCRLREITWSAKLVP